MGCFNMLASGSLYVFALYASSFTSRLGYSQTQTSMIGIIGDIGLYGVGPVSGFMADRLGPQPTSFVAALLLGLGYCLLSIGYSRGLDNVAQGQPPTHFLLMALFLFLAGMGSSASYMAAFTSLTKNFKSARGIALGIPVSFFGLSAAVLTLLAQGFFMMSTPSSDDDGLKPKAGKQQELDTIRFLLFLGMSGGLINALSVFGLNIWPKPVEEDENENASEDNQTITPSLSQHSVEAQENTPLLRDETLTETLADAAGPAQNQYKPYEVQSISGKAFFLDRDAQSFFVVMLCLAGTGLMIINSISAMVDSVAAKEQATDDVASIRAKHVAFISLSSYTGRILAGLGSDVAIHRYGFQRIVVLPIATACMGLAQLVGMFAPLHWLYLCSVLTGLAYGGFFGVAGIIVAELWGEETCGQNWGWLSWGSAIGGLLFNLIFGVVMDAARPVVDGETQTCEGHGCFRWALVVSFSACAFSCALSVVMGERQKRKAALAR
ncbi:hypothetical protein EMPS_02631 [Entomortierella parvispora]|uniref:Nodulin-like domain-containing protein n=1 Tax=Entomortierella parvispora TaxID=205924 RepID=A0A9P3LTU6_9FUNG|nr:hypothetical protein EMPS_02631 [Entomortierella parvispora]